MENAEKVLRARLPWFSQFDDNRSLLAILLEKSENKELWGFGSNPSPRRSFMTGYIAKALGDAPLAREELLHAFNSGSYDGVRPDIE